MGMIRTAVPGSTGGMYDTSNDTWHVGKIQQKTPSTAQHRTVVPYRTAGNGQGTVRARQGTPPRGTARGCAAGLAVRCALLSGAELNQ